MRTGDYSKALHPGMAGYEEANFELRLLTGRDFKPAEIDGWKIHRVEELTDDRPKIRQALKESRNRHTVRIKSTLP